MYDIFATLKAATYLNLACVPLSIAVCSQVIQRAKRSGHRMATEQKKVIDDKFVKFKRGQST
jgi:uncharacterized protein YijF (DUF1287 family)